MRGAAPHEARGPYGNVSNEAWVRPEDHLLDRTVTLPDFLLKSITLAAGRTADLTTRAAGAAAFVNAPGRVHAAKATDAQAVLLAHRDRQRSLPCPSATSAHPR